MTAGFESRHVNRYATDAARVALMHRLLAHGAVGRVLLVTDDGEGDARVSVCGEAEVPERDPAANLCTAYDSPLALKQLADCSFASIVVHVGAGARRGTHVHAGRKDLRDLVMESARMLLPGGTVVVVVPGSSRLLGFGAGKSSRYTLSECAALLDRVTFDDPDLFMVLPSAESPGAVVSTDPMVARQYLRKYLGRRREQLGRWRWLLWWMLIEMGIAPRLQPAFAIRGRKRCST